MKDYKLGCKNSIKLLNRALTIDSIMDDMVHLGIADSHKELRRQINQKILDLANEKGYSLWDICFNYIPDIEQDFEVKRENDGESHKVSVMGRITLTPLRLEFEKED